MSSLILKAWRFADEKHRGQTRKVSKEEYIVHPMMVCMLLFRYKISRKQEILAAALILHDTVEDCGVTFEELVREFGMEVANIVFEMTNDEKEIWRLGVLAFCQRHGLRLSEVNADENRKEIKQLGKVAYFKKKWPAISNYALLGKLLDRLNNIEDSPGYQYVLDTIEILEHLKKQRKLTKTLLRITEDILIACQRQLNDMADTPPQRAA